MRSAGDPQRRGRCCRRTAGCLDPMASARKRQRPRSRSSRISARRPITASEVLQAAWRAVGADASSLRAHLADVRRTRHQWPTARSTSRSMASILTSIRPLQLSRSAVRLRRSSEVRRSQRPRVVGRRARDVRSSGAYALLHAHHLEARPRRSLRAVALAAIRLCRELDVTRFQGGAGRVRSLERPRVEQLTW